MILKFFIYYKYFLAYESNCKTVEYKNIVISS